METLKKYASMGLQFNIFAYNVKAFIVLLNAFSCLNTSNILFSNDLSTIDQIAWYEHGKKVWLQQGIYYDCFYFITLESILVSNNRIKKYIIGTNLELKLNIR